MNIPAQTLIGFIGVILFLSGIILALAGVKIIELKNLSIQPGRTTFLIGIVFIIAGMGAFSTELYKPSPQKLPIKQAHKIGSTDQLVAYYPFNSNANDESGNQNNGIIHGAVLTDDIKENSNSAYFFDGEDDYIEIPHSSSLSITHEISVAVWIKLFEISQTQYILLKDSETNYGKDHSFVLSIAESEVNWGIADGYVAKNVSSASKLKPNTWYHLVGTYDGMNLSIYIDSIQENSLDIGSMTIIKHNKPLKIGRIREAGTWYYPFHGIIDELMIYKRKLSAAEIETLYNKQKLSN